MHHQVNPCSIFQHILSVPLEHALDEVMEQKNRNCLIMGPMTLTVGNIGKHTVGVMYDRSLSDSPTWFMLHGGNVTKTVSEVANGFQMKFACDKGVKLLHNEGHGQRLIKDNAMTIVVTPDAINWY